MNYIPNDRFRQWRKANRLSQTQLAEKIKVSQGTITDIERGRIGVSKRIADKLFNLYGVQCHEIDKDVDAGTVEINNKTWNFCPHCGQPLK